MDAEYVKVQRRVRARHVNLGVGAISHGLTVAMRRAWWVPALVVAAVVAAVVTAGTTIVANVDPHWRPRASGSAVASMFPDPALAACIVKALQVGPFDSVSNSDLESLRSFGCHSRHPVSRRYVT